MIVVSRARGLILIAVVACCARDVPPPPALDDEQIAGVPVRQYTLAELSALPALAVDTVPVLSVGSDEGGEGEVLHRVRAVIGHPDGGFIVADDEGTVLRRYDARGRSRGASGGRGQGPGEYRDVLALGLLADSLVVLDRGNRRVSVLDDSLHVARSLRLPQAFDPFIVIGTRWLPALDSLVFAMFDSDRFDQGRRTRLGNAVTLDTISLVLMRPHADSFTIDRLARVPGNTWAGPRSIHFNAWPVLAAYGAGFVLAHTSTFEIRRYDARGNPGYVIRVEARARPVTASDRERVRAARRGRGADEPEFADWHPVLLDVRVDKAGNVWVLAAESIEQGRGHIVFDASGVPCGWYRSSGQFGNLAPRGWDLYLGAGHVLALVTDELGVERIVKYRLPRCGF